jgi:hypothetical protein
MKVIPETNASRALSLISTILLQLRKMALTYTGREPNVVFGSVLSIPNCPIEFL